MSTIEQTLLRLQQSAFRAKFHLSEKDRQYIMGKGMETIQHHAADFIRMRLAPAIIPNDGKQTPMRGHPVFIAQHACACCCRSCLNKCSGYGKGCRSPIRFHRQSRDTDVYGKDG